MKYTTNLFVTTLILSSTFLLVPPHAFASTCTYSEKYHTLPQIFLLSSDVFVGTVTSIKNGTNHDWKVNFSIEKLWKGTQGQESVTVTSNNLQGCDYSITNGEKYLVYAISSPPFLQISWTKPYTDAQSNIATISDPNFQTQEKNKENLNEKLEAAKEIVENMMMNNTLGIPFNLVGIDVINSTLNIGIDNTKATLSSEEYKEKIKNIIGDIPIKIIFGQNIVDTGNSNESPVENLSSTSMTSPLKQLKSGIVVQDVQCNKGFSLVIKAEDGSPACVKPETKIKLVERGWGMMSNLVSTNNMSENNCGQFYAAPIRHQTSLPVLLMDSNSTACARLTFTIDRNPDTTLSRINITSDLLIGNYNVSRHVNLLSVAPGKDYTHSFQITVVPKTVDLANFPIGSNFTVIYIIKPLPNATGFYDYSIPRLACERYPLAVGHTADHVNYSDFSYINQQIPPCGSGSYRLTAVEISGMSYKYIVLPLESSNK